MKRSRFWQAGTADQHADAARAAHERHADQRFGTEHAQQLLLGQAERRALAAHEGQAPFQRSLGHGAAF
jgi:hypothetical protein